VAAGEAISGNRVIRISLGSRLDEATQSRLTSDALAKEQAHSRAEQAQHDAEEKVAAAQRATAKLSKHSPVKSKADTLQQQVASAVANLEAAQKLVQETKSAMEQASASLESEKRLSLGQLPNSNTKSLTAVKDSGDSGGGGPSIPVSPIVSVNGTALKMPYDIRPRGTGLVLTANAPDSLLADGGGIVRVSWPFYNPNSWTSSLTFSNPDAQFKVVRVSEKSIVISRVGNLAFVQDAAHEMISPEDAGDHCWQLIAGDKPVSLPTLSCPYKAPPAAAPKPVKGGKAAPPATPSTGPLIQRQGYTVSATVDDLPGQAILLAPNGSIYHLTIPDFPAKKDSKTAPAPVALGQNDSAWVDITVPAGKVPVTVEANGASLKWRRKDADSKIPPKPDPKKPLAIQVEVTRALTAKSGTLDLTVLDAKGDPIMKQQIKISCSQCSDKGDK
jgi:hypothetical protein